MTDYSISWRIQRVTVEYAYVSVPVTDDLTIEQPDGTGRIDVNAMAQRAVELAQLPGTKWFPEDQQVQVHPVQKAPEPEER